MNMFKINIITQLLLFFVIAISVNFLQLKIIIGLFVFLMLLLFFTKNNGFLQSVKRFKWFFMVMILIIAFNTPGQHVTVWPFSISADYISPTYEGIEAGLAQMLRILLMLASLNLIMAINTRQQLISGFYFIFSPLKIFGQYFGLKVERFAARLWLTLHYVELQGETRDKQNFMSQLKNMTSLTADDVDNNINAEANITFAVPEFNLADYLTFLLLIVAVLHLFKVF